VCIFLKETFFEGNTPNARLDLKTSKYEDNECLKINIILVIILDATKKGLFISIK
jgi:hypothetical protein